MYCTRTCELKEISKNCGQWEKETRLSVVRWRENKTVQVEMHAINSHTNDL